MKTFTVVREIYRLEEANKQGFTLGRMYLGESRIGFTLEDQDRGLENGAPKIYGKTAIPRGRYRLVVDFSNHFQKLLPHVEGVPGFEGIRIHGANHAEELLGCIAVGLERTADGVAKCASVVDRIINIIVQAEAMGEECYLEVK